MNLLQVDAWAAFATWVQALTGIIALVLAGFSYFQTTKIKELTDITIELANQTEALTNQTKELNSQNIELSKQTVALNAQNGELIKQTDISQKRYQLETELAFYNSIPYFGVDQINYMPGYPKAVGGRHHHKIDLINYGTTAYGPLINESQSAEFKIIAFTDADIKKDEILTLTLEVDSTSMIDTDFKTCSINIFSRNNRGQIVHQILHYNINSVNYEMNEPIIVKSS